MTESPILFNAEMVRAVLEGRKTQTRRVVKEKYVDAAPPAAFFQYLRKVCPYGRPGDRLWVKERIQRGYCGDMNMSHYFADGFPTVADAWPWKRDHLTSIHCPRGLSRILLEITNVRIERVQDISSEDAEMEGVQCFPMSPKGFKEYFSELWESINAKRGYGWEVNPWVWVIEFRRIHDR